MKNNVLITMYQQQIHHLATTLQKVQYLIQIIQIAINVKVLHLPNFSDFWNNNIQKKCWRQQTNGKVTLTKSTYRPGILQNKKNVFSSVVLLLLQISTRIVGYPQCVLPFEIKSEKERKIYNTINVHVYMYFIFYISFLLFP